MAVSAAPVRLTVRRFGETSRRDAWWIQPLVVFLGLSTFLVYATWAAFQGEHYTLRPVPLAVLLARNCSATRRTAGSARSRRRGPAWLPFSPALLILPIPGLFRLTCYYYRGAYYKAFWADPPSCTVGEPRTSYWGENSFPLVLQNVHRYMLFLSLARAGRSCGCDVWKALWFADPATGTESFGIGVGTLVLAANVRASQRAICSAATRCVTSSAAASTSCRARRWGYARTRA